MDKTLFNFGSPRNFFHPYFPITQHSVNCITHNLNKHPGTCSMLGRNLWLSLTEKALSFNVAFTMAVPVLIGSTTMLLPWEPCRPKQQFHKLSFFLITIKIYMCVQCILIQCTLNSQMYLVLIIYSLIQGSVFENNYKITVLPSSILNLPKFLYIPDITCARTWYYLLTNNCSLCGRWFRLVTFSSKAYISGDVS